MTSFAKARLITLNSSKDNRGRGRILIYGTTCILLISITLPHFECEFMLYKLFQGRFMYSRQNVQQESCSYSILLEEMLKNMYVLFSFFFIKTIFLGEWAIVLWKLFVIMLLGQAIPILIILLNLLRHTILTCICLFTTSDSYRFSRVLLRDEWAYTLAINYIYEYNRTYYIFPDLFIR